MKKILAIALAVVLGLASLSSLALIDRGTSTDDIIIYDRVQLSTNLVMSNIATAASAIGDPAGSYNADKSIFGAVVLTVDQNRTGAISDQMEFKITSNHVTFPAYMNTGFTFVHYTDKNGLARVPNYINTRLPLTNQLVSADSMKATSETDTTKNQVTIKAPVGLWTQILNAIESQRVVFADVNGEKATATGTNNEITTSIYLGFSGVVKDSTDSEGTITAAMTLSAGKFENGPTVRIGGKDYPSIDVYSNGLHIYRVIKYTDSTVRSAAGTQVAVAGTEYLVHPVMTRGDNNRGIRFVSYAVGFKNGPTGFNKLTYRDMDETYGANNAMTVGIDNAVEARNDYLDASKNLSSLKPWYQDIMNFFGFSFAYDANLKDGDFTGKAGLTETKTVTFAYFGTTVTEPDDDVDVPQTGDASASILVVLGASAILAAAALAFVMKKARD